MIQTFFNWLRLDPQNLIPEVWWASLVLWCVLVLMGISSIVGNTLSGGTKIAWIMAIVLLPMVGLFAYCIFCLTRVDYRMLEFLLRKPKLTRRRH